MSRPRAAVLLALVIALVGRPDVAWAAAGDGPGAAGSPSSAGEIWQPATAKWQAISATPQGTAATWPQIPAGIAPLSEEAPGAGPSGDVDASPVHLLVRFSSRAGGAQRAAALAAVGGWISSTIPELRVARVSLPAGAATTPADGEAVAARLALEPAIDLVEVDRGAHLHFDPNDPYYATDPFTGRGQWGLRKADVNDAWDSVRGSPSITVAVLDTGVDPSHPDLNDALVPGAAYVTQPSAECAPNATTKDDNSHGTHVAGIVAAEGNNKIGVAGVAFGVRVMPVKVLDCTGSGMESDIAKGVTYAVDHGAKILNFSLGTAADSFTLRSAIEYAVGKGVLVVSAVGNCGESDPECLTTDQIDYPAAYPGVLGVGATDANDNVASFSSQNATVDVSAPGRAILSTTPTYATYESRQFGVAQGYGILSGTSQASPFAAGVAALVWSADPTLTAAQIVSRLESTADDLGPKGRDDAFGYGRVNAASAVGSATARYGATYDTRSLPAAAPAGKAFTASVAVTNTSSFTWRFADPNAVRLGWSWTDASGAAVPGLAGALALTADLAPTARSTFVGPITAPATAATYTLKLDLAQGATTFSSKGVPAVAVAVVVGSGFGATIAPTVTGASFNAGDTTALVVSLTNTGSQTWPATGATPVHLSYHWLQGGVVVVWDGQRAALPADVAPGATVTVTLPVLTPAAPGTYTLRLDLVQEGVAWFSSLGVAPKDVAVGARSTFVASYQVGTIPVLLPGGRAPVHVTLTNTGAATWPAAGDTPVHLASHIADASGATIVWDGARTLLPSDVAPGASVSIDLQVDAPLAAGPYRVRVDLVREGVGWFSGLGVATADADLLVAADRRATLPTGPLVVGGPGTVTSVPITNSGVATWTTQGASPVDVAVHYHDASGAVLVWDGPRTALPGPVAPGQTVTVTVQLGQIPAGAAFVTVDLVSEGVAWFGAGTLRPLTVAP